MDKILIEGGHPLKGIVKISGAKNATLPILAATLLTCGWSTIHNVPRFLGDIITIKRLLSSMGVEFKEDRGLKVNTSNVTGYEAPYDLVKTMRASVLVLGPLIARMGRARVSLPGGCAIGARPINLHLKGLESLGVHIQLRAGYIEAKAKRLRGATIYFDIPTVTGTENLMMASTLAQGTTILENAAKEPEVVALACFLNKMGAKIWGAGTDMITIEGVKELSPQEFTIIPDRIEAGTYMAAAGITGGNITIKNCDITYLEAVVNKLKGAGVKVHHDKDGVKVVGPKVINSINVKTSPYPGFPTDMQAQFMALMSLANGTSLISESVFENRFMHVAELRRMGADIEVEGHTAIVKGVKNLTGAQVMATDLRASASLVLAGLAARGTTEISRVYHLDRGYERIENKLSKLGAHIWRVSPENSSS
ncbi:MAG TPA: UDP-N-acetylglucosamine 1-carboxyvinyltransferase, partial [Syntrophaceae bacterium]|nr:UDP-N-acetylglucosamine 1-carboxyvinyltransferase [Syntrophaceae bacterium]